MMKGKKIIIHTCTCSYIIPKKALADWAGVVVCNDEEASPGELGLSSPLSGLFVLSAKQSDTDVGQGGSSWANLVWNKQKKIKYTNRKYKFYPLTS